MSTMTKGQRIAMALAYDKGCTASSLAIQFCVTLDEALIWIDIYNHVSDGTVAFMSSLIRSIEQAGGMRPSLDKLASLTVAEVAKQYGPNHIRCVYVDPRTTESERVERSACDL